MAPTVWTSRRKWLGNLIPASIWLVPTAAGIIWSIRQDNFLGIGLIGVIIGLVAGLLAVNFFGLFENEAMKRTLEIRLRARGEFPKDSICFVGFARPEYSSMLDPHEDVGFLELRPNELRILGESLQIEISKSEVKEIRFRPNVHSIFGLGRWISIETEQSRLLIEPRQLRTLRKNLRFGRSLRAELEAWLKK